MRKILLLLALISSSVLAADLKPYLEGQFGLSYLDDVDIKPYTSVDDGLGTVSASAKIKYDHSVSGGFEFGANSVVIENLRIGVSFNRMKFDMDKVTGTLTVATVIEEINGTYTGDITSRVNSFGISLDNSVNLYMANAYYDIKNSSAFTPFVGLGMGMADIKHAKDNEFAWSASVGGKYNIDKNIYLGLKGSYTSVNGITDKQGIQYKDMDAYSAYALLGYQF